MNRHLAAGVSVLSLTASAFAGVVSDTPNDFLPTYTGIQGGDLDVRTTQAFVNTVNSTLSVTTTLGGAVGSTPGGFYVFGFDRGAGTERFVSGTPSVGAGVRFDLVLLLRPDGTSQINDLVGGTSTPLPAGTVVISGNTISSLPISLSLFPTRGLSATEYTFNLWPRVSTITGNAAISDFAPDASNALVTAVPAPASAAVLLSAGILGSARRSRRPVK